MSPIRPSSNLFPPLRKEHPFSTEEDIRSTEGKIASVPDSLTPETIELQAQRILEILKTPQLQTFDEVWQACFPYYDADVEAEGWLRLSVHDELSFEFPGGYLFTDPGDSIPVSAYLGTKRWTPQENFDQVQKTLLQGLGAPVAARLEAPRILAWQPPVPGSPPNLALSQGPYKKPLPQEIPLFQYSGGLNDGDLRFILLTEGDGIRPVSGQIADMSFMCQIHLHVGPQPPRLRLGEP